MKIGQISFMQLSEPTTTPYGSATLGSKYQGQRGPDAEPLLAELPAMKVLVAGGTGFVGTAIVHALRARAVDVRVLARRPERAASLESLGVELARGDLTEPDTLGPALEGCTHVVNLVAILKGGPPTSNG